MDVLVDTSVWVDHFKNKNERLCELLNNNLVITHPFILGELSCGTPPNRKETLYLIDSLQKIKLVSIEDIIFFVEDKKYMERDAGLLMYLY